MTVAVKVQVFLSRSAFSERIALALVIFEHPVSTQKLAVNRSGCKQRLWVHSVCGAAREKGGAGGTPSDKRKSNTGYRTGYKTDCVSPTASIHAEFQPPLRFNV